MPKKGGKCAQTVNLMLQLFFTKTCLFHFLFSRVLRDSISHFSVGRSVGRSVGPSVRNTLLFCAVFGHFGLYGVILSHFFVVFGHFWLVSVIFGHFWSFLIIYVTLFILVICVIKSSFKSF